MFRVAFTLFSILFAAEVLAKYHPKTARYRRPSAKLVEVVSAYGERFFKEMREAAARMNRDDRGQPPPE
jgi:hypothetical protein